MADEFATVALNEDAPELPPRTHRSLLAVAASADDSFTSLELELEDAPAAAAGSPLAASAAWSTRRAQIDDGMTVALRVNNLLRSEISGVVVRYAPFKLQGAAQLFRSSQMFRVDCTDDALCEHGFSEATHAATILPGEGTADVEIVATERRRGYWFVRLTCDGQRWAFSARNHQANVWQEDDRAHGGVINFAICASASARADTIERRLRCSLEMPSGQNWVKMAQVGGGRQALLVQPPGPAVERRGALHAWGKTFSSVDAQAVPGILPIDVVFENRLSEPVWAVHIRCFPLERDLMANVDSSDDAVAVLGLSEATHEASVPAGGRTQALSLAASASFSMHWLVECESEAMKLSTKANLTCSIAACDESSRGLVSVALIAQKGDDARHHSARSVRLSITRASGRTQTVMQAEPLPSAAGSAGERTSLASSAGAFSPRSSASSTGPRSPPKHGGRYCSWCLRVCNPERLDESRSDVYGREFECDLCLRRLVICGALDCKMYACWSSGSRSVFCHEHQGNLKFELLNAALREPYHAASIYDRGLGTNYRTMGQKVAMGVVATALAPVALVAAEVALVAGPIVAAGGAAAVLASTDEVLVDGCKMLDLAARRDATPAWDEPLHAAIGAAAHDALFAACACAFAQALRFQVSLVSSSEGEGEGAQRSAAAVITVGGLSDVQPRPDGKVEPGAIRANFDELLRAQYAGRAHYHCSVDAERCHILGTWPLDELDAACAEGLEELTQCKGLRTPILAAASGGSSKNEWARTLRHCEAAGLVLADTLRRCVGQSFILVGSNIGVRVINHALTELAAKPAWRGGGEDGVSVEAVHLFSTDAELRIDIDAGNFEKSIEGVAYFAAGAAMASLATRAVAEPPVLSSSDLPSVPIQRL